MSKMSQEVLYFTSCHLAALIYLLSIRSISRLLNPTKLLIENACWHSKIIERKPQFNFCNDNFSVHQSTSISLWSVKFCFFPNNHWFNFNFGWRKAPVFYLFVQMKGKCFHLGNFFFFWLSHILSFCSACQRLKEDLKNDFRLSSY